jgi:hypothetical protein
VLWYDGALGRTVDIVGARELEAGILGRQNKALLMSNEALAGGLEKTSALAEHAGVRGWWESPSLWLGVGFFLGAGTAIGIMAVSLKAAAGTAR